MAPRKQWIAVTQHGKAWRRPKLATAHEQDQCCTGRQVGLSLEYKCLLTRWVAVLVRLIFNQRWYPLCSITRPTKPRCLLQSSSIFLFMPVFVQLIMTLVSGWRHWTHLPSLQLLAWLVLGLRRHQAHLPALHLLT